jgi:hypothetical protein
LNAGLAPGDIYSPGRTPIIHTKSTTAPLRQQRKPSYNCYEQQRQQSPCASFQLPGNPERTPEKSNSTNANCENHHCPASTLQQARRRLRQPPLPSQYPTALTPTVTASYHPIPRAETTSTGLRDTIFTRCPSQPPTPLASPLLHQATPTYSATSFFRGRAHCTYSSFDPTISSPQQPLSHPLSKGFAVTRNTYKLIAPPPNQSRGRW